MTVGAPDQLCKCPTHCVPSPARRLATSELRRRALEYVATLTDGSEIHADIGGIDSDYVAPFAEFLPEMMIAAGFAIGTRLDHAGRVVTIAKTKETR